MSLAIAQARIAGERDEVPVGALIVDPDGKILAAAYNQVVTSGDPTAHAEILALREAARKLMNYRLLSTSLYVTVEPCVMCMGAIVHARVARLIFGAPDPKWGAAGSLYDFSSDPRFNHHPEVTAGVHKAQCRELMQAFFRDRRK